MMNKKTAEKLLIKHLDALDLNAIKIAVVNYNHAAGLTHTDDVCELVVSMINMMNDSIDILRRHIYYHES